MITVLTHWWVSCINLFLIYYHHHHHHHHHPFTLRRLPWLKNFHYYHGKCGNRTRQTATQRKKQNWFNTFNNKNISINWLFVNFPLGKASSYKLTVKVMFRSHDPRRVKLEYFQLGHLHDGVILLLRPESLSFFLLYLNLVIPARFKQQKS